MDKQNSVALVPVSDTQYAVVDIEDLAEVLSYTWCVTGQGYAHARIPNTGRPGKHILMHRLLCAGDLIDHINRNRLDNRRANLRSVTRRQNALNSSAKGVYRHRNGKWVAQICLAGKTKYLGSFISMAEALCARQQEENKHI